MAKHINASSINMLIAKIEQIDVLESKYSQEAFDQWHTETELVIEHIFGEKSEKVETFNRYDGSLGVYFSGESTSARSERERKAYYSDLKSAGSFLKGLLDFLQKIVVEPETSQTKSVLNTEQKVADKKGHFLHPVISDVAGPLFQDGHYRDAIRSALIEVIDRVKVRTGRPKANRGSAELDGDDLINQTFSSQNSHPKLYWNDLKTSADRDFQQGMYFLFKGLVFLRNEKGHVNVEQKDKEKAYEYLCLASLLMRQIDDAEQMRVSSPLDNWGHLEDD